MARKAGSRNVMSIDVEPGSAEAMEQIEAWSDMPKRAIMKRALRWLIAQDRDVQSLVLQFYEAGDQEWRRQEIVRKMRLIGEPAAHADEKSLRRAEVVEPAPAKETPVREPRITRR